MTRLSPAWLTFLDITCSSCLKMPMELPGENSGGKVHLAGICCSTASFVPPLISPLKLLVKESFLRSILQEWISPSGGRELLSYAPRQAQEANWMLRLHRCYLYRNHRLSHSEIHKNLCNGVNPAPSEGLKNNVSRIGDFCTNAGGKISNRMKASFSWISKIHFTWEKNSEEFSL